MKLTKYFLMASVSLLLTSCLDSEPGGSDLTSDQKAETVEQNPERLEAAAAAITANFSQYEAIRSAHSDFGYGTIMMHLEARGIDEVADDIGYNWFGFSLTYDNVDYTYGNNREIWGTLYNQIYSANALAATVDSATTDPQLQYYLGQALAIRAFDYFNLVQIYQKTYSQVDPNTALGVPLITEKNSDEAAANGCPRATVAETYNQILSDLNGAIALLDASGISRADKRYVNSAVAHAIRARVYLVMNRWNEALADANYVIQNGGATPKSLAEVGVPSFNDMTESDWLWGIKVEETDDVAQSDIVNFPSHLGSLNYGYATVGAWKRINKKLYNNIPASDKRKTWFTDENAQSAGLTANQQAYLDGQGAPGYVHVKFAPYNNVINQSTNASDIPLIRIEEMYYIKAEAEAMSGNTAQAVSTLNNFVRTYRDPAYNLSASSATAIQDAIWMQRRVEFWGEGISWFDLIRLHKDFDRRGGGYGINECYNIPAGSWALIWRIPQAETEYNKQITAETNNPASSKPTPVADED